MKKENKKPSVHHGTKGNASAIPPKLNAEAFRFIFIVT